MPELNLHLSKKIIYITITVLSSFSIVVGLFILEYFKFYTSVKFSLNYPFDSDELKISSFYHRSSTPILNSDENFLAYLKNKTNSISSEWFIPRKRKKTAKNQHYLLRWETSDISYPSGTEIDHGDCVEIFDKSKLPDAEIVIFRYNDLDRESMPWRHYRDEDQIFAYRNFESPAFMRFGECRRDFRKFDNGFINLTLSLRTDSDIFNSYASKHPELHEVFKKGKQWTDEIIAQKSRMALWVVSDCSLTDGAMKRMEYSNELVKAGLQLDRYGRCFQNKQAFAKLDQAVLNSYKFYLAFENALHCKDYITEKFYRNALGLGRVPVVWGPPKETLLRLAPTNSFIHTEDFDSPASLVSYLKYLDKNETAYREYFQWIENPDSKTKKLAEILSANENQQFCDIAKAKYRPRKTIQSMTSYYLDEPAECFHPKRGSHCK